MIITVAERAVVECDFKAVQLEYDCRVRNQPLVLRPAVRTLTAGELLRPATARVRVRDGYQGLGAHPNLHDRTWQGDVAAAVIAGLVLGRGVRPTQTGTEE